ncbi:unnamed protein product [Paramecium primaurelia]|uniref:Transmembrane protein n=1 Tax=Paramecium primaurelia TaxID=5886 RepID=A0A8S1LXX6_PARPR|nr:unnamed protein product [Paramecium primaurelia]
MNFLKRFDQFGVSYQQEIFKNEKQFKSAFGGITSLLLYTLSMVYFFYKLFLWLNGDILPRVSIQKTTQNYADVSFEYNPIIFQVVGMSGDNFIDPFSKTENIITPYFSYVDDIVISKKQLMLDSGIPPTRNGISTSITPQDITLVLNQQGVSQDSPKTQRQLMILFEQCDSSQYDNCANKEKQEQFFKQPLNTFFLTIQMQQYNTKLKDFEMISKQIYFILDKETALYTQLLFKITTSITDTGFFLESIENQKLISDFQTTSQQLPQSNFEQSFGNKYLGLFLIGIDSLSETQQIIYPKLGEILADVGSIMSTLMMLKLIVIQVNSKILEDTLLNTIISYYYPEIQQVQFKSNFFGKIISISKNGKQISDMTSFIRFYDQLKDNTKEKLTLLNQIYEVSRIQFILQSIQSKQAFRQSHFLGIRLQNNNMANQSYQIDYNEGSINAPKIFLKSSEKSKDEKNEIIVPQNNKNQPETIESLKQVEILTDEDFTILSHMHHLKKQIEDQDKTIPIFYQINTIFN